MQKSRLDLWQIPRGTLAIKRATLLAATAWLTTFGVALAAAEITVEQHGNEILVHAQSDVDADRATIWSTLSDYDHLAGFIPGMSSSRTVSRTGAEAVVEQKGSFGVGPFRQSFTVLLAVKEELNQTISASGIGGEFRYFESRYEIVPVGSHQARIVYQATLVPKMAMPPIVGLLAMLDDRRAVQCAVGRNTASRGSCVNRRQQKRRPRTIHKCCGHGSYGNSEQ